MPSICYNLFDFLLAESNDLSDNQLLMINKLMVVSLLSALAIVMLIALVVYRHKKHKGFLLLGQDSDDDDADESGRELSMTDVKVGETDNDFDKAFENFHLSSFRN